jgi:hypothetical protein
MEITALQPQSHFHLGTPYIYTFDCKSDEMHSDFYVFFITPHLLYMFRVLYAPIIRSTNCRVQP